MLRVTSNGVSKVALDVNTTSLNKNIYLRTYATRLLEPKCYGNFRSYCCSNNFIQGI